VDGSEAYLNYDLLVGADGVRSGVRAAFIANHRDFECSVEDVFERFKSIHIDTPEGVEPNFVHVFPNCFRNMNGRGLPETGNRMNISIGHRCHQACDEALKSSDASVVAEYFREHFKAFPLPYDEVAEAWVKMEWQSTTMTRCKYYHSDMHQILIMGDAAHATSPSIGMGINHALGDAAALDELFVEHGNDLSSVLPMYSSLRVKEGHALTEMAALIQSYDTGHSFRLTVRQAARTLGNKLMPSVVAPDPFAAISNGMKLSEAYAELHRMGRITAVRRKNSAIKQRHSEVALGLIQQPLERRSGISRALGCWL
jgi:kynurenine 3-monooxygenase